MRFSGILLAAFALGGCATGPTPARDRLGEIDSWDKVKLLTVAVDGQPAAGSSFIWKPVIETLGAIIR